MINARLGIYVSSMSRARRRAFALVLVLFSAALAAVLAYTFVASQSTLVSTSTNATNALSARALAESALNLTMAHVRRDNAWRGGHSNGVWASGASLLGGTVTIRGEDGWDTDDNGVISVPAEGDGDLADDPQDDFTLTITAASGGATATLRTRVTPTPANHVPLLVYGKQDDPVLYYRTWADGAWSAEKTASNVGAQPRWVVSAWCPTRMEAAACTLNSNNELMIQFFDGSSWSAAQSVGTNTVQSSERPVDIAYESVSGDLLIAYRQSGGDALNFRTYDGTTLSSVSTLSALGAGSLKWVGLTPKPGGNEIIAIMLDSSKDVSAAVWNGSTWANGILLENDAAAAGDEGISAAYESQSGHALVAWSVNGQYYLQYRTWNGSTWSAEANSPSLGTAAPRWVHLRPDSASDVIMLGSLDTNKDIYLIRWTGSTWDAPLLVETDSPSSDSREFDVSFVNGGMKALAVWGRAGVNNCYYRLWSGSAWGAETLGPGTSNKVRVALVASGSAANQAFVMVLNKNSGALDALPWNGSTLGSKQTIAADVSGSNVQEAFAIADDTGSPSTGRAWNYNIHYLP